MSLLVLQLMKSKTWRFDNCMSKIIINSVLEAAVSIVVSFSQPVQ